MKIAARARVFKTKRHEIQTIAYKEAEGEIGADMDLHDFVKALADEYGNPSTTFTIATHTEKLLKAAEVVISEMKVSTKSVAAIEPNKIWQSLEN